MSKILRVLRAAWFLGWLGCVGGAVAWWYAHRVNVSAEAARPQIKEDESVRVPLFFGNTGMEATSISDLVLLGESDAILSSLRDTDRAKPPLPIPLSGPGEVRADLELTTDEAHQVRAVLVRRLGGAITRLPLVLFMPLAADLRAGSEMKAALSTTEVLQCVPPLNEICTLAAERTKLPTPTPRADRAKLPKSATAVSKPPKAPTASRSVPLGVKIEGASSAGTKEQ